jgi:hypothetical protein
LKRDTEAKQNDAKCVAVGDSMLSNVWAQHDGGVIPGD